MSVIQYQQSASFYFERYFSNSVGYKQRNTREEILSWKVHKR